MKILLQDVMLTRTDLKVEVHRLTPDAAATIEEVEHSMGIDISRQTENIILARFDFNLAHKHGVYSLGVSYTGQFQLMEPGAAMDDPVELAACCGARLFPYVRELVIQLTAKIPLIKPIALNPTLGEPDFLKESALIRQ